jgi:hypothetical protein
VVKEYRAMASCLVQYCREENTEVTAVFMGPPSKEILPGIIINSTLAFFISSVSYSQLEVSERWAYYSLCKGEKEGAKGGLRCSFGQHVIYKRK